MAWQKTFGDYSKWLAQGAYENKEEMSTALAFFGFPTVAAFLMSPQLAYYAENYGVPTEQVWDALWDVDFRWRGEPSPYHERVMRALAQYVVDENLLDDPVIAAHQPPPPELPKEELLQIVGGFILDQEGGRLLTPEGESYSEEQVVCATAEELEDALAEEFGIKLEDEVRNLERRQMKEIGKLQKDVLALSEQLEVQTKIAESTRNLGAVSLGLAVVLGGLGIWWNVRNK